jgi:flotillin
MVFVSSDGASGSKLTGDVATMLASLPAAVEGVTGVNIVKGLAKYMGEAPMAPIPEKR